MPFIGTMRSGSSSANTWTGPTTNICVLIGAQSVARSKGGSDSCIFILLAPSPPLLPFTPTDDPNSVPGFAHGIEMSLLLHKLEAGKRFHSLFQPCCTSMCECRSFSVNSCSRRPL
jgi:hypothetical protein